MDTMSLRQKPASLASAFLAFSFSFTSFPSLPSIAAGAALPSSTSPLYAPSAFLRPLPCPALLALPFTFGAPPSCHPYPGFQFPLNPPPPHDPASASITQRRVAEAHKSLRGCISTSHLSCYPIRPAVHTTRRPVSRGPVSHVSHIPVAFARGRPPTELSASARADRHRRATVLPALPEKDARVCVAPLPPASAPLRLNLRPRGRWNGLPRDMQEGRRSAHAGRRKSGGCTREEEAHTSERRGPAAHLGLGARREDAHASPAPRNRPYRLDSRLARATQAEGGRACACAWALRDGALPVPGTRKDASVLGLRSRSFVTYRRLKLSKNPALQISKDSMKARRGGFDPCPVWLLMGAIAQLEDAEDSENPRTSRREGDSEYRDALVRGEIQSGARACVRGDEPVLVSEG
ncbi:hypothetical protein FB451DRAFT_1437983 [Mycena latifolia]|nr:hypothetical protein FB451DRAFT_1441036 [Mycena latifolia]KAJ7443022.1 hypothetical protein FB451DRAFT_1437983 [Mycena latifolia]